MSGSRKVVGFVLAGGVLAIGGIWLLLEIRAREEDRFRAVKARSKGGSTAPAPKAVPEEGVRIETPALEADGSWDERLAASEVVPGRAAVRPAQQAALSTPPGAVALGSGALGSTEPKLVDPNLLRRPERDEVEALQSKALDLSIDPTERLNAVARLRIAKPDGRSPEVVRGMIDLLRTASDASIRADVCRQLKGVRSKDLKEQLCIMVRTEQDPRVREGAIESLGPVNADPAVRQVLETSLATDPDERVRLQAKRSLSTKR